MSPLPPEMLCSNEQTLQKNRTPQLKRCPVGCRSFGVALWECVQFGALPYSDLSNDHVVRLVIREKSIRLPKPDLPITHLDRLLVVPPYWCALAPSLEITNAGRKDGSGAHRSLQGFLHLKHLSIALPGFVQG